MNRPRDKRYIISLFVTVIGLFALIFGTSYAILRGSTVSTNEQVITAGSVELKLTENFDSIDNGVSVMKDTDGLLQETVYEFSVTNIGSVAAKYDLKLLNEAPSGQTALSDEYIRLGLEVNGQEMGPMGLSKVNSIIDSNTIYENEVIRYKLRVWLDKSKASEIEADSTKKAYLSLKVDAKQSEYTEKKSTYPEYVYRYGINNVSIGTSITPVSGTKWIVKVNGEENAQVNQLAQQNFGTYYWDTHQECTSAITSMGYTEGQETPLGIITCAEKTGTFGGFDYTEDYTALNKQFFLKHNISSEGTVESSEVCYILNSNLYCLKGGDGGTAYSENTNTLQTSFGESSCSVTSDDVFCSTSGLNADSSSDGGVAASDGSSSCGVNGDGISYCNDVIK